ncbi:FecR domain-containing protein [bacterium]|jgi:hypothetical protein|nr:FecR domain-containing protein [bacterium]
MKKSLFLLGLLFGFNAFAAEHIATVTTLQGEVKLFTHPSKKLEGPEPHALYEGIYYSVQDAKPGQKVEKGNILRTALSGKVQVVFNNGDQFVVGPGTAYVVDWDAKKMKLDLMYGRLRGVIEKGGPRSGMTIRTRSATMGVRGTDFFISENGMTGHTEVTVVRGEVSVASKVEAQKAVAVKSGYSAVVAAEPKAEKVAKEAAPQAKPEAPKPEVQVIKTTQEHFAVVQKASKIEASEEIKKAIESNPTVAETVKKLEEKAAETTLKDIKKTDPALYAQVSQAGPQSVEELNAKAVQKLAVDAPKGRKTFNVDGDIEKDAYDQFFKMVD